MQCGNVLCRTPSMHASKFIHKTRGACRSTQGLPLSRARQAPRKARELPTLCNHCLPEYDPRLTYRTDREKTPCAWRVFAAKPAICRLSYARATNVPCGAECLLHAPFRALPFRLWGSRSHLQYLIIPPYYDLNSQFAYNYKSLSVCITDCVYSLITFPLLNFPAKFPHFFKNSPLSRHKRRISSIGRQREGSFFNPLSEKISKNFLSTKKAADS